MQKVFVKALTLRGRTIAVEVDVPERICRMTDGAEQYQALAEYINEEYDTDRDPIDEVIDARGYC